VADIASDLDKWPWTRIGFVLPRADCNLRSRKRLPLQSRRSFVQSARLNWRRFLILIFFSTLAAGQNLAGPDHSLSRLKKDDEIGGFRVANLYSDRDGAIAGAKFWHKGTGAPIYVLQIETTPQVYMWVDTPPQSNAGIPHSLEHLLAGKGIKGRYAALLTNMRLSLSAAATTQDFNLYELSSGTGLEGFYEQFHAWLDALYRSDFSDLEAKREFYHFDVATDPATNKKTLLEEGTVYNEQQTSQGLWSFYYDLYKHVLGETNPFGFNGSGTPDAMRGVTPAQIRAFYEEHYRIGPGTGFIFVISPKESVPALLQRVSQEFQLFTDPAAMSPVNPSGNIDGAKYPIMPSDVVDPEIYFFPAESVTSPGQIRFAWKPVKTDSLIEVKLLQLLVRALGEGEQSLLYASLVDQKSRRMETHATGVYSSVFLANSPRFPVVNIGVSGIPGDQISKDRIKALEALILSRIQEITRYPDHSPELVAFNRLIASYAKSWHTSENVWTRNAPLFGYLGSESNWKEHLAYLELDTGFVRSLTTENAWHAIDEQLASGTNIWRAVIDKFGLISTSYATASAPSVHLLEQLAAEKEERIKEKTQALMDQYHTGDAQQALALFEAGESANLREIQAIEARVPRPRFTQHPPLTLDDSIRYRQLRIAGVDTIATIFERPPTIDMGLSFDLSKVPPAYYKYLALFPRCLDSLGLKHENSVVTYSELLTRLQQQTYKFSAGFDSNALSRRAEFIIHFSATDIAEFQSSLDLIQQMMSSSNIDPANLARFQDIIARRISADDSYTKQDEGQWITDPATALRYQDDALFVALNSHFTRAHWDERLKWIFHEQVEPAEIVQMRIAANRELASLKDMSRNSVEQKLNGLAPSSALQNQLFSYWKKNLYSFPENELVAGFQQLTSEVEQDLRIGPAKAIAELKHLRQIIINRKSLSLDFTVDQQTLMGIKPLLVKFLGAIPNEPQALQNPDRSAEFISARLQKRYPHFKGEFPWYVAFPNREATTGGVVFTAAFPGYAQLDRQFLVDGLATKLFSGAGPQSLFMKTWEMGLAYNNGLTSSAESKLLTYYADRSPNLTALIQFVNSSVQKNSPPPDQTLVDYAFSQTFPLPRSMLNFSQRGLALARDIRDSQRPEKVRRFSLELLKLRSDPRLPHELIEERASSIGSVLTSHQRNQRQQSARSIFFFIGPPRMLSDAETHLKSQTFLYVCPADYWMP
jgi:Zn-dependent M16 (insulinase) family peptidase